jgi:hypothetical protein
MESKPVGFLHLLVALDHEIANSNIKYQGIVNSLSLISSLPNELLSTILEAGYLSSSDHTPGDMRFEVVVSQVTGHWQGVSLRTPQL